MIGRWGLWEMLRALMKGIKFPYKRNPREPLTLRPCEDTGRRWWSMNQDGGVSPDTESARTLIVAFAAFRRTTRNKWFLSKTRSLVFCYSSPTDVDDALYSQTFLFPFLCLLLFFPPLFFSSPVSLLFSLPSPLRSTDT